MYLDHFGLKDFPFRLNADPRYFYMSETHSKAYSYLKYGLEIGDKLIMMSGEIGSGKTTLVNYLLNQLGNDYVSARIHQTQLKDNELLQSVLLAFGEQVARKEKVDLLSQLNDFLIKQHRRGKRTVLLIDEAQHLSVSMFEDIRLISDSEINGHPLLSVLLVGQPELRDVLDYDELKQLKQRIRLKTHLKRLSLNETTRYIDHRLKLAGYEGESLFSIESLRPIYYYTGGCLRLVNILCDYALTHCFTEDTSTVTSEVIRICADELGWDPYDKSGLPESKQREDGQTRIIPILNNTPILKLLLTDSEGEVSEYTVRHSSNIGRHKDNDIVIESPRISRFHAEIIDRNGRWYVRDLDSMNGIRVNGARVDLSPISSGDTITMGGVTIRCIIPFAVDHTGIIQLSDDLTVRKPSPEKFN